jgi:hypothetical protein
MVSHKNIGEQNLSVSYDGDFDKYWTKTDTTIETNDDCLSDTQHI